MLDLFGSRPPRKATPKREKELLFDGQGGKCNYCGRKFHIADMHVDHKTPLAKGGSDRISNKQILCGHCNTLKGPLTDGEFRRLYKLTPVRQAKGPPPRPIKLEYFKEISKTIAAKKAKLRRQQANDWLW